MKIPRKFLAAFAGLLAIGTVFAAEPTASPLDPQADQWLKAASAHLAAAKTYSFNAEVWEDAVLMGHKISTTKTVATQVRRPDRVQMEVRTPKHSRAFWYDGKSLTLLNRAEDIYGTISAPDTIDKVLEVANDKFGINFPLEDLLVSDLYASSMVGIKESVYFGMATILGTSCHHIAFSTDVVDWQLWIQDGPAPLIRKFVITYKQEDTAPQFTAIFSDWKLGGELADASFVFTPPKGASKVEVLPASADTP